MISRKFDLYQTPSKSLDTKKSQDGISHSEYDEVKKSVPSKMGFLSSRSIIGKNARGGESTYGGPGEQDGVIWVLSAPPAIYLPTFLAA